MKPTVTRVQVDLPPSSYERLNALKERTEATSNAEVIKAALRVYEAMVERQAAGARIFIADKNGKHQAEYVIL